jgi:hypothetical protein
MKKQKIRHLSIHYIHDEYNINDTLNKLVDWIKNNSSLLDNMIIIHHRQKMYTELNLVLSQTLGVSSVRYFEATSLLSVVALFQSIKKFIDLNYELCICKMFKIKYTKI